MSNLELIEKLCGVVEMQSAIIRTLSSELEQLDALSAEDKALVEQSKKQYSDILGAEEYPDEYSEGN